MFAYRMIGIRNGFGKRIGKNTKRFVERNTMFLQVDLCFLSIPSELHSGIVTGAFGECLTSSFSRSGVFDAFGCNDLLGDFDAYVLVTEFRHVGKEQVRIADLTKRTKCLAT